MALCKSAAVLRAIKGVCEGEGGAREIRGWWWVIVILLICLLEFLCSSHALIGPASAPVRRLRLVVVEIIWSYAMSQSACCIVKMQNRVEHGIRGARLI